MVLAAESPARLTCGDEFVGTLRQTAPRNRRVCRLWRAAAMRTVAGGMGVGEGWREASNPGTNPRPAGLHSRLRGWGNVQSRRVCYIYFICSKKRFEGGAEQVWRRHTRAAARAGGRGGGSRTRWPGTTGRQCRVAMRSEPPTALKAAVGMLCPRLRADRSHPRLSARSLASGRPSRTPVGTSV